MKEFAGEVLLGLAGKKADEWAAAHPEAAQKVAVVVLAAAFGLAVGLKVAAKKG